MAKAPVLKFDAATHRYTVNGLPVPNVTSVIDMLANWEGVPADILKAAGERGTAVHLATELEDENDLDWDSLDPILAPYVEAWQKFKADVGFVITASESRVYHSRHHYAGTLDRTGYLSALHDEHSLLDIKTSAALQAYFGIQTAAYTDAVNHSRQPGSDKITRRYVVQLKSDGRYKLEEYREKTDGAVFLALLKVHQWRLCNEKNYKKTA